MCVLSSVGSAMEALHSIQNFLKGRPKSFKSMDHAIEWRLDQGLYDELMFVTPPETGSHTKAHRENC